MEHIRVSAAPETTTSETDRMMVQWDCAIPMDDGVVLRADAFLPPEPGSRAPVILSYGPYGKGLAFQEGYPDQWNRLVNSHPEVARGSSGKYQCWEVADPERWVPFGYACVRVDSRGSGRSPGFLDPFSPRETRDVYECIEWAAAQSWSSGKVGMLGVSYFAINQWHVAALQPPHLAAICPWEGAADWYRDMCRHGGILTVFWDRWMTRQVVTVQHGLGERGSRNPNTNETVSGPETLTAEELAANRVDLRTAALSHPLDDLYYRDRSPDWSKVKVPLLTAANWGGQGLHSRGSFEAFMRAASNEKWLEVHGLEHWTTFYVDYGIALQKQFLDHYLKGENNGWVDRRPVLMQVRGVDGFQERLEDGWPIARTRWTALHIDASSRSLQQRPPAEAATASYNAANGGVSFLTAPFAEETELTGPLSARLVISSSTSNCDLFLVVQAWDPNGREVDFQGALDAHTPIAQGWLRASHRHLDPLVSNPWRPYHTHDREELLEPGREYPVDVEIWPTSIVLPAGYRLSLTVQGRDLERATTGNLISTFAHPMRGSGPFLHEDPDDRPADLVGATVTIHTGGGRESWLLVPVIPMRPESERMR